MTSRYFAGLILWLGLAVTSAGAEERAIIVLDASGSMWGQIDGTPKIAIARDVLGDVLGKVPSSSYLGLMAYGHREKGNCGDIELLIAPAPGSAAEITGMAKDISPKGKTPLSSAVRQAADALKFSENKATVILITDGLETFNADPCAVAQELEAAGLDFTAHVVGFGLSPEEGRQVACLAEGTGGKSGARRDSIDVVMEGDAGGKPLSSARLSNGDYDGQKVSVKAPKETGRYLLRYWNGDSGVVLATRPITVE